MMLNFIYFQAEDGIRDGHVTGVQTCALPIYNQWLRLYIAFERYPKLKRAYEHAQRLTHIYQGTEKAKAIEALKKWICEARKLKIKEFETCANTLQEHLPNIVNYFDHRSTNASAESFNAKIKQFRALQRGVRDSEFFLFRLTKLYA